MPTIYFVIVHNLKMALLLILHCVCKLNILFDKFQLFDYKPTLELHDTVTKQISAKNKIVTYIVYIYFRNSIFNTIVGIYRLFSFSSSRSWISIRLPVLRCFSECDVYHTKTDDSVFGQPYTTSPSANTSRFHCVNIKLCIQRSLLYKRFGRPSLSHVLCGKGGCPGCARVSTVRLCCCVGEIEDFYRELLRHIQLNPDALLVVRGAVDLTQRRKNIWCWDVLMCIIAESTSYNMLDTNMHSQQTYSNILCSLTSLDPECVVWQTFEHVCDFSLKTWPRIIILLVLCEINK